MLLYGNLVLSWRYLSIDFWYGTIVFGYILVGWLNRCHKSPIGHTSRLVVFHCVAGAMSTFSDGGGDDSG